MLLLTFAYFIKIIEVDITSTNLGVFGEVEVITTY